MKTTAYPIKFQHLLSILAGAFGQGRSPLKVKILDPKNISADTIKTILDNAAIDHHDNGGIYVTNYSVNFWIEIDQ